MCGIAGILGRIDEANRAALARMEQAMAHRGPDGAGIWVGAPDARGHGCLFAHRRLSILDLSTAADQPMIDRATGKVIVFNGEIYNYVALRDELVARGEVFDSSGDTAVMLRSLAVHGGDATKTFRGMFAFALWDDRTRELLLARDPHGIKPLYIARSRDPQGAWTLIFASEVRAILASGLLGRPQLDAVAVASVVWNGFVMGPGTAVLGVEGLFAGEQLRIRGDGSEHRQRYWSLGRVGRPSQADADSLAEALQESVRAHLVSDVPLGVFLSSGVDSSVIAHLAQRGSARPINTFTLAFEEAAYNEGGYAQDIARAIGTQHREVMLTESRFIGGLERALEGLDQPTFDGLNSYFMSQAVREAGLTVALVGTGGDELFGGYTSFRHLPRFMRLARVAKHAPALTRELVAALAARATSRTSAAVAPQTKWAKLPAMIRAGDDLVALYQLAYALFLPEFQRDALAQASSMDVIVDGVPALMRARVREEIAGRSVLSAISVLEQRWFLGERLLRDSDVASMAVSLELRLPLVDSVVTEHVDRLPDELRYRPRKGLLREVGLAGLDPALFERPKVGFVLPLDRWIRAALGREMNDVMRDPAAAAAVGLQGEAVARLWRAFQDGAPGMYWSRVWAIYVLIQWCHRNRVLL